MIKRPIDRADHPIESGNYRIGTPAIETAYMLIKQCLSHRITGALIYGPSRIGKTRAIEYLRLLMAPQNPKVTTCRVQCRPSTSPSMPKGRCRFPFKLLSNAAELKRPSSPTPASKWRFAATSLESRFL